MDDHSEVSNYNAYDAILAFVITVAITFLSFAFVSWSADLTTWHWTARAALLSIGSAAVAVDAFLFHEEATRWQREVY
jgi:VIT1/CCC1 family predicted Fe2+/Mn2+ transporter